MTVLRYDGILGKYSCICPAPFEKCINIRSLYVYQFITCYDIVQIYFKHRFGRFNTQNTPPPAGCVATTRISIRRHFRGREPV